MEILDQQIEILVQQAPQDGVTVNLIKVIAPLLKQTASQLRHPEYHVIQGEGEGWLLTTLSNRVRPEQEKSVIYAFPTEDDAQEYAARNNDHRTLVVSVPIIHILFQLIALQQVDSVIFVEHAGGAPTGTEVACGGFRRQIQQQIEAYQAQLSSTFKPSIPPDIA
ncbi:MAG: hypothetical protein HC857_05090 [Synechococcales cyanobacterium RU_4_20]|nr:hypothetical protein [Synechococcales cyanobacterium RU_4_20]